jgi:hypothetical protein
LRFSAHRGAYAKGRHCAVAVDPRWNDDQETIRVIITCYSFGHRLVDWAGLPIFVVPEDPEIQVPPVRLTSRGQAVIPQLPPGKYGLLASAQWGDGLLPVSETLPWIRVYASTDLAIQTTVRWTAENEVIVAAQTREENFAGATVRFSFRHPRTGSGRLSGQVTLRPSEGKEGLWEGRWFHQREAALAAAGDEEIEVVFCVVPPSG